jgi:hypothetical protein
MNTLLGVCAGGLLLVGCSGAWAQEGAKQVESNPAGQPQKPAPGKAGEVTGADDLLRRLETADAGLKSLEADVLYHRVFGLEGDEQERRGKLYFVDSKQVGADGKPAPGSRKFAIDFKTLKMGKDPAMTQDQVLVFDGEWLIEKKPVEKQIVKRQITRAGQGFDPLKVGEGPFPLPIGQKREDILRRFDAELLPAGEGLGGVNPELQKALVKFVEGAYQLKLTPKPGDLSTEFKEVRLWYRADQSTGELLPRLARTVTKEGDIATVQLANVKVNQPVPGGVMDTTAPEGWKQDIQELPQEIRR